MKTIVIVVGILVLIGVFIYSGYKMRRELQEFEDELTNKFEE